MIASQALHGLPDNETVDAVTFDLLGGRKDLSDKRNASKRSGGEPEHEH